MSYNLYPAHFELPLGQGFSADELERVKRDAEAIRKKTADEFLKRLGIKYCPFDNSLIKSVKPNKYILELGGEKYPFHGIECHGNILCDTAISLDGTLVKILSNLNGLREVEMGLPYVCPTCRNEDGRGFYTGLKLKMIAEHPLYLFKRGCHSYAAANFGSPDLRLLK